MQGLTLIPSCCRAMRITSFAVSALVTVNVFDCGREKEKRKLALKLQSLQRTIPNNLTSNPLVSSKTLCV